KKGGRGSILNGTSRGMAAPILPWCVSAPACRLAPWRCALNNRRGRPWAYLVASCGVLLILLPARAASSENDLRDRAVAHEKQGQWLDACACYDQLVRTTHNQEDQDHFLLCLRHVHQLRRHRDPSFLQTVLKMKLSEALLMYEDVLNRVQANYVEQDKS